MVTVYGFDGQNLNVMIKGYIGEGQSLHVWLSQILWVMDEVYIYDGHSLCV